MTPAARIQSVIELAQKIRDSRIPMDGTIGDYMRHRRYIGGKDRANIAERLYSMVRAQARIGWWLDRTMAEDTVRNRVIAWLMLGEARTLDAVETLFDASRYGPESLSEPERDLARRLEGKALTSPEMPVDVRVECPPQHADALKTLYGDDFESEMAAMIASAPLDLRANLWRISRDEVQASLAKDGVRTVETPYSPWGLRATEKVYLSETKAFTKGLIEIQDEGSQLIALACAPKPGMQVLDYCAGGGGKTLALASAMKNKGRIVACDIDAGRLAKAKPRYKRAGVHDIIEVRPLSDEKNRKWLRRQKETFDIVLTDVPCSGIGTWRRNPDQRWRSFGPSLDELLAVQAEILDRVAKTVKPGGRLVYATCSLLPAENEDQITAFLARDESFELLPLAAAWPQFAGAEEGPETAAPAVLTPPSLGDFMRLSPKNHNTDGFFAAVLLKKG